MWRLLHGADFHLGRPARGLGRARLASFKQEERECVFRFCQAAERHRVDAVLLSGDLFDGANAFYEDAVFLRDALREIEAPVFIAPGNHDPYGPASPYAAVDWPERVHIFKSPVMERMEAAGLIVYGAGFNASKQERPILRGFRAEKGRVSVGVLHGDRSPGSPYNPLLREDIAASGLAYLALGHIHAFARFSEGAVPCCYPGCLMGGGFDETGPKGAVLVTVDDDGRAEMEFLPLARREYRLMTVSVAGCRSEEEGAARILDAVQEEERDHAVRVRLTGAPRCALSAERLEKTLEDRFFALSVRLYTEPEEGLFARAGDDSLLGLYMGRLRERYEKAEGEEEKALLRLAAEYARAAAMGRRVDGEGVAER